MSMVSAPDGKGFLPQAEPVSRTDGRQMAASGNDSAPKLQSVLSIAELNKRPSRPPDYAAECRALMALASQLAASPDGILQRLTEAALTLCEAHSSGISLLDPDGKRFYWPSVVGRWAEHVGGGTPREYGPCGTVLDRNSALLFSHPELDFDYFAPVTPLVEEALLVPFYVHGKAVGTVWVVLHDLSRRFDCEDFRVMTDLAAFAASAYQVLGSLAKSHAAAAVVASSHDAIVTKDLNGVITSWNTGAEHLFGYTPEEAIGRPVTILIPADHENEESEIINRVRRGERIDHYETVRVRKDGVRLDISLTVSPVVDSTGKIIGASKIARDISERKRMEERVTMLVAETEHRTKNIMATVQAAVHLSHAENVADFKKSIEGRIQSMANVQRLFAASRWAGAELRQLIAQEIEAYRRGDGSRLQIGGPEVFLKPDAAQTLAVTIHELATNAAKYGALSVSDGHVAVNWATQDSRLVLSWIETDGPSVTVPTGAGFGTRVMRRMIQQVNGEVHLDWRPEGLACEITIPI
jgi:PAS domain S-box-containing protein